MVFISTAEGVYEVADSFSALYLFPNDNNEYEETKRDLLAGFYKAFEHFNVELPK